MSFDAEAFFFSADLKPQAVYQLDFLERIARISALTEPVFLARSVYRYEKYWLPLAAENPTECLSAPIDIEWVWHCHMLSPRSYIRDCMEILNTMVNHTLRRKDLFDDFAKRRSSCLWEQRYSKEGEPFDLDFKSSFRNHDVREFKSNITYNIVTAASRQNSFYYQVSLPHYRDSKYLDASLIRYNKFLYLKQQLHGEFIVPCYDIDLIRYTHQLNPHAYKNDVMTYIGEVFNHDDSVTDRSEGSKLYHSDIKTRDYWKSVFNESFPMFGAMHRGSPSPPPPHTHTQTFIWTTCRRLWNTTIYAIHEGCIAERCQDLV